MGLGVKLQVLPHSEVIVHSKEVGHVANVSPGTGRIARDVLPGDPCLALRRQEQSRQDAQGGGLPGSVGPHEAVDGATGY